MSDVTTFKRAAVSYVSALGAVSIGEVRASTDAQVTTYPAHWIALSDTEMVRLKVH